MGWGLAFLGRRAGAKQQRRDPLCPRLYSATASRFEPRTEGGVPKAADSPCCDNRNGHDRAALRGEAPVAGCPL